MGDVHLGTGPHVSCLGKGRKQRITPLTASTAKLLDVWMAERAGLTTDPLFPTRTELVDRGTRSERRLAKYTAIAAKSCPTLVEKRSRLTS